MIDHRGWPCFLRGSRVLLLALPFLMQVEGTGGASSSSPDLWKARHMVKRSAPVPAPDHPGNIFVLGEEVTVRIPPEMPKEREFPDLEDLPQSQAVIEKAVSWQLLSDRGDPLQSASLAERDTAIPPLALGKLPVGWYRIEFLDADGKVVDWTTAAVLSRPVAPTRKDSPVCLDVALSWLAKDDPANREDFVQLASLAGINWIRDRLRWREVQPDPETLVPSTKYDSAAGLQNQYGLKVLQTFHQTPVWAAEGGRTDRSPGDLRHLYRFCKEMANRFKGTVQAWEPWNEGNAGNFGGLTTDEMCSLQKAAYLGFKAGDPDLTVCWNPIGGIDTKAQVKGILKNETWPYYDVYSIHSYDWPHAYEDLWVPAREAACGRPIWVTECDRGMAAENGLPWGDFSREFELRKAEFLAQSYVRSLFSGSVRHFHFILGHYMEGENRIQFGLLRRDLTPRAGYVALAALGRFLAGGKCLGRLTVEGQPNAHVYAFRAWPDGQEKDVLVGWTENRGDWQGRGTASVPWTLPDHVTVEHVHDYLGRPLGKETPQELVSSAVFICMPPGESEKLPLSPTAPSSEYREGAASPIVLQLQTPGSKPIKRMESWTQEHERGFEPGSSPELLFIAYNFAKNTLSGTVRLEEIPEGWNLEPDSWEVSLKPMDRIEIRAKLTVPPSADDSEMDNWIGIRADFGKAGQPSLAFRVLSLNKQTE